MEKLDLKLDIFSKKNQILRKTGFSEPGFSQIVLGSVHILSKSKTITSVVQFFSRTCECHADFVLLIH